MNLIYVAIGGALGAVSRYGINKFFEIFITNLSIYSSLLVNIVGCFLIGLFLGNSITTKDTMYYFLIIGFLGSFTTMSAFTHQVIIMINTNFINALSYIIITVALSIFATYFGTLITK